VVNGTDKSKRALSRSHLISAAAIAGFVVAWEALSYVAPSYAVPHWSRILRSLVEIPMKDVLVTFLRLVASMMLSFVLGLTLSLLMFERPNAEAFFLPLIKLLMAVPAVCWVVFAILWFKGVEPRIFFVMMITCAPVFTIDSLDAMKGIPNDLKQMARSFRPSNAQVIKTIIIPGIVPNLLTSWKINLTLAVRVVTIAELVGAVNGIGHGLVLAQEMFSIADVFAWTVVLVIMLYFLQGIVSVTEHYLLRWRTGEA
jgi:ABC-type nitrate/sulfonate/bicarbonate transport system permease component